MKKILLLIMAMFTASIAIQVVSAAETTITGTNKLTITRDVKKVTNPVTNTFSYHIEADAGNPAAVTGLPADFNLVMNAVAPTGTTATGTVNLDMSSVKFTELGDYSFTVTEKSSSNETEYPKDTQSYTVLVSVRNEVDANNVPTGNLIATLVNQAKNEDDEKQDMKFESESIHTHIELSKGVTGNMARKDKYFAFTVNIPGTTGDIYKISGSHSTDGSTSVNQSNYTVGTTTTIYLKHGDLITIGLDGTNDQIPVGTTINITETGATDYKTYINGSPQNNKATGNKDIVETDNANFNITNKFAYVNNKEEATLTGLFLNIAPFIILFLTGTIGIYYIRKTNKEKTLQ